MIHPDHEGATRPPRMEQSLTQAENMGAGAPAILFVCLGNICRSPLAEGALRREAERLGIDIRIDSAGTGDWHVGNPPDRRARAAARRHGFDIDRLVARQVAAADFGRFDHIYALDRQNLRDLEALRPEEGGQATLALLADEIPGRKGTDIADPYYEEDESAFDRTVEDVVHAARAIVARLSDGRR